MNKIRKITLVSIQILNGLVMTSMFAILFAQVLLRRFFNHPLSWPEEISLIALVWITFVGAFQISLNGQHLKMDVLENYISEKVKNILQIIATVFIIFFLGITIYFGFPFIQKVGGTEMPITKIPMYVPYYIILFSFILMLLEYIYQFVESLLLLLKKEDKSCSQS